MIKSQDDLNKPETRSTEVLFVTISKLETTTKELERTKKQLGEAVLGLKKIGYGRLMQPYIADAQSTALKTLDKIKELEK